MPRPSPPCHPHLTDKRLPYLVALTADATEGVDARCALAGFHQVLTKPCDVETLRGVLQAMSASATVQAAMWDYSGTGVGLGGATGRRGSFSTV